MKTLDIHTTWVVGFELLSNNRLAIGSFDKTIKIWNITSWNLLKSISISGYFYWLTSFEDLLAFTLVLPQIIQIFNSNTGEMVQTIRSSNVSEIFISVKFMSDGNLACELTNDEISIYDPNSGELARSLRGLKDKIHHFFAFCDGKLVSVSEESNEEVKFWDLRNEEFLGSFSKLNGYNINDIVSII